MGKSWKIHYKWPFSIAMLNYQRVPMYESDEIDICTVPLIGDIFTKNIDTNRSILIHVNPIKHDITDNKIMDEMIFNHSVDVFSLPLRPKTNTLNILSPSSGYSNRKTLYSNKHQLHPTSHFTDLFQPIYVDYIHYTSFPSCH
jgi:hypothetical protein